VDALVEGLVDALADGSAVAEPDSDADPDAAALDGWAEPLNDGPDDPSLSLPVGAADVAEGRGVTDRDRVGVAAGVVPEPPPDPPVLGWGDVG
jgi:hypothetical protein